MGNVLRLRAASLTGYSGFYYLAKLRKIWYSIVMSFRSYDFHLIVNGLSFNKVEIDDHYEQAHADHMDDKIILELVRGLNNQVFEPVKEYDDGLKVFVTEPLLRHHKPYRLVWFYYDGSHELRVRTAFRTRRRK